MADNTQLSTNTGSGDLLATKEVTHGGDTAKLQSVSIMGVTGTEGSYTIADIASGGGVEAAALRVTIASDSTGVVSVDDNGGSLTVDGTVTANLSATDNAVLDTIASTVNAAATVYQNIRVTDGTSFVTPGSEYSEDAATPATIAGSAIMMERDDALSTLTPIEGDWASMRCDANGALWTTINGTVTVGSHAVTNAGTFATQVDGAALTALQLIDNPVIVDDAAFTPATSSVMMAGFQADEASTDSVDEGDAGAARMTLDRKVITTPQPHTAGGLSIFRSLDLDESEEDVKTSAGQVYSVWVTNLATSTRFVKFYNATAANVTVGTTTPVITLAIPGNSSDDVTGQFTAGGYGIAFDTAICVAATTGIADNDTGAPGANEVLINVFYK